MKNHKLFTSARILATVFLVFAIFIQSVVVNGQGSRIKIKFNENSGSLKAIQNKQLQRSKEGYLVTGNAAFDNLAVKYHATSIKRVFRPAGKFEERHIKYGLHLWYELEIEQLADKEYNQSIADFKSLPEITIAEAFLEKKLYGVDDSDKEAEKSFIPNDPMFPQQWHYLNTGQTGGTPGSDINLVEAWDIQKGSDQVIVAVIDMGIDIDHPDLAGALWVNEAEANGTAGVDDDNNGYIDDINGYCFGDDSPVIPAGFHATHVAGTIGGITNNGIGVSGVAGGSGSADGVRMMSLAGFGDFGTGGFDEAFIYAADMGAIISQNSWGYIDPGVYEQSELDAIDYFIANAGKDVEGGQFGPMLGGIVIFAAGNDDADGEYYPGYYEPVMAVAALTHTSQKAYYSNYGTWIEVSAPGGETIYDLTDGVLSTCAPPYNTYDFLQGTSMACPHVSGIAALIVSEFGGPGFSPQFVWDRLVQSADNVDVLNPSYIGQLGSGRVNAFNSLETYDTIPPAAITDLAATDQTAISVTLNWTAVGSSGTDGKATFYILRYSKTSINESNFDEAILVSGVSKPKMAGEDEIFTVSGLMPGTMYYFAIKAVDLGGYKSDISNIATATTDPAPVIAINPAKLNVSADSGETLFSTLQIKNIGDDTLEFSFPEFDIIKQSDKSVNNTSYIPFDYKPQKGQKDKRTGHPVIKGSGDDGIDGFGYRWKDSNEPGGPIYSWIDISGTGTEVALYDDSYIEVPLPFGFDFYGITYTSVFISSNGFVTFNEDGAYSLSNAQIPDEWAPNAFIAALWCDLYPSGSGIFYYGSGSSFVVMYKNVPHINGSGNQTFEIILYPTGEIRLQYKTLDGDKEYCTVGIENPEGTEGLQVAFNTPYLENNLAIKIDNKNGQFIKSVDPASGSVPSGDSIDIQVEISANELEPDNYEKDLGLATNDPSNPSPYVPVTLHVNGIPQIGVSPEELNFGEVFITYTDSLPLTITNTGTDSLHISSITGTNSVFYIKDFEPVSVYINDSVTVPVFFAPPSDGIQQLDITINSNALDSGNYLVHLTGTGAIPPAISVSPDSMHFDLFTGDSVIDSITIKNSIANSILRFEIASSSSNQKTGIDVAQLKGHVDKSIYNDRYKVHSDLKKPELTMARNIEKSSGKAKLFAVDMNLGEVVELNPATGEIIKSIYTPVTAPWGPEGLAFDGENLFYTDGSGVIYRIDYGTQQVIDQLNLGLSIDALACSHDKLYVLEYDNAIYEVDYFNELILDTIYSSFDIFGGLTYGGSRGTLFCASYGLGIFEINIKTEEVVNILPNYSYFYGLAYSNDLGLLFGADNSYYNIIAMNPDDGTTQYSFAAYASGLAADETGSGGWLQPLIDTSSISGADSLEVPIKVDAEGMYGGNYRKYIHISSNDPANSDIYVPVDLHVTGVPLIETNTDTLHFGEVFTGNSDTLVLTISNIGTDLLAITAISTNEPHFGINQDSMSINPGHKADLKVWYHAGDVQEDIGQLSIESNDTAHTPLVIQLDGKSVLPPVMVVSPESITVELLQGASTTESITISNVTGGSTLYASISDYSVEAPKLTTGDLINSAGLMEQTYAGSKQPFRDRMLVPVTPSTDKAANTASVLIIYEDGSDISEISGILQAYSDLTVGTWNANTTLPDLQDLTDYNSVIICNNGSFYEPDALGDVLADYVDAGGYVIGTVPTIFVSSYGIGGRLVDEGYLPVTMTDISGTGILGEYNENHRLMQDVTSAESDLAAVEAALAGGAEEVARFIGNGIFVAVKGNVIAINVFVAWAGYWTGDIPQLFYNAVKFSSGAPWIDILNDEVSVAMGTTADVSVLINAADLTSGEYYGGISVTGNDPLNPEDVVSVHLTVTGVGVPENPQTTGLNLHNIPNPCRNITEIIYELHCAGFVEIDLYNLQGELVDKLVNADQTAGKKEIEFNTGNLNEGVYLYRLVINGVTAGVNRMIIE